MRDYDNYPSLLVVCTQKLRKKQGLLVFHFNPLGQVLDMAME